MRERRQWQQSEGTLSTRTVALTALGIHVETAGRRSNLEAR